MMIDVSNPYGSISNTTEHIPVMGATNIYARICSLIVSLVGLVGNGGVLYIYTRSTVMWDSSMKAVFTLSLADFLALNCSSVTIILYILEVYMSKYVCFVLLIVPYYLTFVSQIILFVITFERYVAICHYEKYIKFISTKPLHILFVLSWILPLYLVLPMLTFNYWDEIGMCLLRFLFHEWINITQSIHSIFIMAMTLLTYIPILRKAWGFHARHYPAKSQAVNQRTMIVKAKQRSIRNGIFTAILTIAFMICNLPFSVVRFEFGRYFSGKNTVVMSTIVLGMLKSVINPFLYAWRNENFRFQAKKYLRCKSFVREVENTCRSDIKITEKQNVRQLIPRPPQFGECQWVTSNHLRTVCDIKQEEKTPDVYVDTKKSLKVQPRRINVLPNKNTIILETEL